MATFSADPSTLSGTIPAEGYTIKKVRLIRENECLITFTNGTALRFFSPDGSTLGYVASLNAETGEVVESRCPPHDRKAYGSHILDNAEPTA
jgi:hypothetical protein